MCVYVCVSMCTCVYVCLRMCVCVTFTCVRPRDTAGIVRRDVRAWCRRYAGPGTQMVTEQFQLDYGTYLSSTQKVVYVTIDGRGSKARGDRHLHEVYRRLGTVEVQDQITAGRYVHSVSGWWVVVGVDRWVGG